MLAWRGNGFGQADIPDLPAGATHAQVVAGHYRTVVVKSSKRTRERERERAQERKGREEISAPRGCFRLERR